MAEACNQVHALAGDVDGPPVGEVHDGVLDNLPCRLVRVLFRKLVMERTFYPPL